MCGAGHSWGFLRVRQTVKLYLSLHDVGNGGSGILFNTLYPDRIDMRRYLLSVQYGGLDRCGRRRVIMQIIVHVIYMLAQH